MALLVFVHVVSCFSSAPDILRARDSRSSRPTFQAVAGVAADGRQAVNRAISEAQNYKGYVTGLHTV